VGDAIRHGTVGVRTAKNGFSQFRNLFVRTAVYPFLTPVNDPDVKYPTLSTK
jgi:hypothetical protein